MISLQTKSIDLCNKVTFLNRLKNKEEKYLIIHYRSSLIKKWFLILFSDCTLDKISTCFGISHFQLFWLNFDFLLFKFALCSKPLRKDNSHKICLIQEINNVIRVRVEPRSCNQGRHKRNFRSLIKVAANKFIINFCFDKLSDIQEQ